MKKFGLYICLLLSICSILIAQQKDVIYQVSNLNALAAGVYDGDTKLSTLKNYGNFGIGTFNHLDGEMIYLDSVFYQVDYTGKVNKKEQSEITPFADVTSFEVDLKKHLGDINSFSLLREELDKLLPTNNIFYAFRIDGEFKYIKTRSVPAQLKPYKPLVEITKSQATFEFENIKGTIIGYKFPQFVQGINLPGYHFHFLSSDKTGGGHLLECSINSAELQIDFTNSLLLTLPDDKEYYSIDLDKDRKDDLKKAEK